MTFWKEDDDDQAETEKKFFLKLENKKLKKMKKLDSKQMKRMNKSNSKEFKWITIGKMVNHDVE